MINIENESPLSLNEAAKQCPALDGRRPHISTIFRWMQKGCRGVQLEHVRIGRRWCTSKEALNRFFEALTDAPPAQRPVATATTRTPKQRARDIAKARETLAAHGIDSGAA